MNDEKLTGFETRYSFIGFAIFIITLAAFALIAKALLEAFPEENYYIDPDFQLLPWWMSLIRVLVMLLALGVMWAIHCMYIVVWARYLKSRLSKEELRIFSTHVFKSSWHCWLVFRRLDRIVEGE